MSDVDPIAAFWRFWRENRAGIVRAIDDGSLRTWVEPVSRIVHAIDPRLDWEFGKGIRAQHYLCLSAKGSSEVRVTAERWCSAGPGDDTVFEFHAARPGSGRADFELDFGAAVFDVRAFRVIQELDDPRARVDVQVWHPAFARVAQDLRGTATFVALDTVLGEDEVERWIGAVELLDRAPDGGVGLAALNASLDALRARAGERRHTLLQGQLPDGRPVIVAADLRLKRVDHLLMDTHLEVQLSLRDIGPNGMPQGDELARVREAEQRLDETLGHDAVFVARETGGGLRTTHFHAAETGPALARIDAWARVLEWPCDVRATRDPAWSILKCW